MSYIAFETMNERLQNAYEQGKKDFAHELKETFNQEFPSNYPSTKPYFTLENVRKLVDEVLAEMEEE